MPSILDPSDLDAALARAPFRRGDAVLYHRPHSPSIVRDGEQVAMHWEYADVPARVGYIYYNRFVQIELTDEEPVVWVVARWDQVHKEGEGP